MAGFDFEFHCRGSDRDLGRSLLEQLQTLARRRRLKVRFRWAGAHYYVTVDGRLPEMQAFLLPVAPYLSGYSEAHSSPRSPKARRRVCTQLLGAYWSGVERISEGVREVSGFFGGTPSSYLFEVGAHTHLTGPLKSFTRALIMYHSGLLPPAQIAESAHTVLEILLKGVLPAHQRGDSFQALVNAAITAKYIPGDVEGPLLELKNIRRDAKHRGQGVSSARIDRLLPSIISASQRLAASLCSGTPLNTPPQSTVGGRAEDGCGRMGLAARGRGTTRSGSNDE